MTFLNRKISVLLRIFGGAEGNRTLDLLNAIQALSQLSYGPTAGRTTEQSVLFKIREPGQKSQPAGLA